MGRRLPLCLDGLGCRTLRSLPARFRPRSLRDGGHLNCTVRDAVIVAQSRTRHVQRARLSGLRDSSRHRGDYRCAKAF